MTRLPHVRIPLDGSWGLVSGDGPLMWVPLDNQPSSDALQVSVPNVSGDPERLTESFEHMSDMRSVFPGSTRQDVRSGTCAYGSYMTCRIVGAPVATFHIWLLVSPSAEPVAVSWESDNPLSDEIHAMVMGIAAAPPLRTDFVKRIFEIVADDFREYGEVPIQFWLTSSGHMTAGLVDDVSFTDLPAVVDHVRNAAARANAAECALVMQLLSRDPDSGKILTEWVDVFLASRDRRERWQIPIVSTHGTASLGSPQARELSPAHPAYVLLPLPYPVLSPG